PGGILARLGGGLRAVAVVLRHCHAGRARTGEPGPVGRGRKSLDERELTTWSGRSGRCQPGWGKPEDPGPGHARTGARRGFAVSLAVAAAVSVSAVSIGGTAAATQAITPSLTGPVRTVTPTLLGLNAENTTGPRWDNSQLDAVLKNFAPGVLRYPGGTSANYWDWRPGWFQPGKKGPAEPPTPVHAMIPVFSPEPH